MAFSIFFSLFLAYNITAIKLGKKKIHPKTIKSLKLLCQSRSVNSLVEYMQKKNIMFGKLSDAEFSKK